MQLPTPGQWFQQRYELGELLGQGGFAAVYHAIDHDVGREVAIKILMPGHNGYEKGLVQRFMREGQIVAALQEPNTVTMYDFGRTETDLLFMVFEYIPGRDLAKTLIRTGPMPEATVAHILRQVLAALREAHAAGILHRDIKPANIITHTYMDDDWRVKLLDFGIAKPTMKEGEVDEIEEKKSGMSPGTPRYMSPEQIYGDELTPATDIFSLGLVAYELLSGKPAVSGRTTKETLLNQLSERPILLPPFLRVSPPLRALVERMCLKRAALRPQSAQEVLRELNAIGSLNTGRALPSPQERTAGPRPPQRAPVLPPAVKERATTIALVLGLVATVALLLVPASKIVGKMIDDRDATTANLDVIAAEEPPPAVTPPPDEPAADAPTPPADDPQPELAKALPSGCGEPLVAGPMLVTYARGTAEYPYLMHVPANYDPDHRYPLLLLLRDDRDPGAYLQTTNFSEVADEHGVIVVVPRGEPKAPAWSPKADAVWLAEMLDDAGTQACVDPTRRFAYAEFDTARSLESLACYLPLDGIALASYLPSLSDKRPCVPPKPVPTLQLFGDGNIHPDRTGGSRCNSGLQRWSWTRKVARMYAQNDCRGEPTPFGSFKHGECFTKTCVGAPTVHCDVEDSYEPEGVNPLAVLDFVTKDLCNPVRTKFDVPAAVWHFFSQLGSSTD